MTNSLRRYHLGCGERLQAFTPFVISMNKLAVKHPEQSKSKSVVKKKKAQH